MKLMGARRSGDGLVALLPALPTDAGGGEKYAAEVDGLTGTLDVGVAPPRWNDEAVLTTPLPGCGRRTGVAVAEEPSAAAGAAPLGGRSPLPAIAAALPDGRFFHALLPILYGLADIQSPPATPPPGPAPLAATPPTR